jgi:hypothetical protein
MEVDPVESIQDEGSVGLAESEVSHNKKKKRKKCRDCPKCLRRKEKRMRKVAKEVRRRLRLEREHELIESFSHCNFSIVSRESSFVTMERTTKDEPRQQIQR